LWEDYEDDYKKYFADMLFFDKIETFTNSLLTILFIVPSIYLLVKYKRYMDHFTKWMIIIYIIGFISINYFSNILGKILFTVFDLMIELKVDRDT